MTERIRERAPATGSQPPTLEEIRPSVFTMLPGAAMIAVTFGLARYGYGLLLPQMRSELGLSASLVGFIASGTYLTYLVANACVVWLNRRFGTRIALMIAAGCAAIGMTAVATAQTAPALAIGVLVAGAAGGLAFPPYADLVARQVRESRQDVARSVISSGTGWGVAVAGPIAILAGDAWRLAWAIFIGLAVLVGIGAALLAPSTADPPQLRRPQLSLTWFVCPRSRPLLVSAMLIGLGSSVWWAFSVDTFQQAGIATTTTRIIYATCGAAGLLASLSGAAFARAGLRVGYLMTSALLGVALVVVALAAGRSDASVMAAILFGASYNAVIAAHGIWSARVFTNHPSAGLAAVNTALTIGTLLGPPIAGAVIGRWGHLPAFLGAAAAVTAALPFCPPTARHRRKLAEHNCRAAAVRP